MQSTWAVWWVWRWDLDHPGGRGTGGFLSAWEGCGVARQEGCGVRTGRHVSDGLWLGWVVHWVGLAVGALLPLSWVTSVLASGCLVLSFKQVGAVVPQCSFSQAVLAIDLGPGRRRVALTP